MLNKNTKGERKRENRTSFYIKVEIIQKFEHTWLYMMMSKCTWASFFPVFSKKKLSYDIRKSYGTKSMVDNNVLLLEMIMYYIIIWS